MSASRKFSFGATEIRVFVNPAEAMGDKVFADLYQLLLDINAARPSPLEHRLLEPIEGNWPMIRDIYGKMVVSVAFIDDQPVGFLLSPILECPGLSVVHSGLVVIKDNPGVNLLGLLSLCMALVVHRAYGRTFFTNISSTPSIIETFSRSVKDPWPGPHANLLKPSATYRTIARRLFEDYVLNYFPYPESVEFDEKRFTIRSESELMGFNTTFRQLSRSCDFTYLNFCFTWLDYDREEDMIQVGEFGWLQALKARLFVLLAKYLWLRGKPRGAAGQRRLELVAKNERKKKSSNDHVA